VPRKIRAKDPFEAVKARIRDIRRRPYLHEPLKESHAREMFARKVALPLAKRVWGKRLKAVLLVGSAQPGTRKATLKRKYSDLDLIFVVNRYRHMSRTKGAGAYVADRLRTRINEHSSGLGFRVQVIPVNMGEFRDRELEDICLTDDGWRPRGPFTVLHGQEHVRAILGKRLMTAVLRRPHPIKKTRAD